jgi:FkbM family methyltransferase
LGSLQDRGTEWALRASRALPKGAWRRLAGVQHGGARGRRAIELLTRPIRYRDARVLGGRMAGARINLGGSFLRYLTGDAEPEVQQTLSELLSPAQVVYDVGANIGFFTLLCARLVGPGGSVYAFEPMPRNAATLRHNLALNGIDNVVVVEQALADSSGTAELLLSHWSAFHSLDVEGAAKRAHPAPGSGQRIRVPTVTLDEFIAQQRAPAPDLVKLDVEGAELLALAGMRETLLSAQPLLLCELHGTNRAYVDFLASIGYDARVIDGDRPPLAQANRNVHTLAWPRERPPSGHTGDRAAGP